MTLMSKHYSISELAQEFDVTTRAIRFYEDAGLLHPERQGQTRIYSARDRVLLKLILRGKRLGFSLAECGELFSLYDPAQGNQAQYQLMLDKLAERRQALQQQLHDIRLMQIELDTAEARIRAAQAGQPFTDDALGHVTRHHDNTDNQSDNNNTEDTP